MMVLTKGVTWGILHCLLIVALANCTTALKKLEAKKYFHLDDLVGSGKFANRKFNGTWISGHEFIYSKTDQKGVFLYNLENKSSTLFLAEDILIKLKPDNLVVSPDQKFLLAVNDAFLDHLQVYSWRFQLYDIENGFITELAGNRRLSLCFFARDHSVVYVLDNNVFYIEDPRINLEALPLTTDGIPDTVYNMEPDYVYGDAFYRERKINHVSGNGRWIAITCFDDSKVDYATFYTYGHPNSKVDQYPKIRRVRYPDVGKTNPTVKVKILSLANSTNLNWVTFEPPTEYSSSKQILAAKTWASDNELAMLWMNRVSDKSVLVICNVEMRTCKNEVHHQEVYGWLIVHIPLFSRTNNKIFFDVIPFLQNNKSDGEWFHIAKYTRGNETPEAMTSGLRTVISIEGWNEDVNLIYYLSTLEEKSWNQHLFVAGSRNECISCDMESPDGELCSYVTVKFSHDYKYFVLTCESKPPSYTVLYDAKTAKPVTLWQDNAVLRKKINKYHMPQIKYLRVHLLGSDAFFKLFYPPQFDPEDKDVKYPLIVQIYSGPNVGLVTSQQELDFQIYLSTKRNYIYARIEGRGSGLKGNKNLFENHHKFGTLEVDDVINGTRHLINSYSWIDKNKVALWGWSYGGYTSLQGLIRDHCNIYKCGVSVAPLVDLQKSLSMHMERYMGMATPEDNLEGYNNSNILNHVMGLHGKRFAILHGNADENIHYADTLQLFHKLQNAGIDFEQMSYPEEAHSLLGVLPHVYHFIDDFWKRCFSS